ncbi:MAG: lipopolysaccharide heptosyltransferase II [Anaerolineae bacterium]
MPLRDSAVTLASRILSLLWPAGSPPPLSDAPHILVLKPCCLGDVLMATAVLEALRRQWPGAEIDFAVGKWSRPAVEHHPHIRRLIDCGRVGEGAYTWRDWLALARRIRAGRYDLCLVLDRSPLMALLPAAAGVPWRVGLDSAHRGIGLTRRVPAEGITHEVELYLACARALGISTEGVRPSFYPTPAARERIRALIPSERPLAVLHPAGGQNPGMVLSAKRWPAERFAEIVRRLVRERSAAVMIVGGPGDRESAEKVQSLAGEPAHVHNLAGKLSFDELGALLERSAVFVGNDTGAMHLATAVGTPTVAIFGPSDPRRYGPYGAGPRAVWNPPGCAPCFDRGRWNETCRRFQCIEAVGVEDVWQAVSQVWPAGKHMI